MGAVRQRFRSHGAPWFMEMIRRQGYRDAISLLAFAHAAEFSGVRRVTFDEVVAKTAGVPGASNLMQASPDRPDEGNVDYAMDTFLIVWLGVNGSIISAWGKATAYMFDVLCGVSDVVVPVLGDMPAPAPKRTPAAIAPRATLAIKTSDLENQLAELKAKMDRLDVEKPALECELKAAAKAAGRTHGAMDAFLGKRKAD
ncbi:hypothetical protein JL720_17000 [Aureococcus anophagefferens]|nr:hypothetical protein JL720_17000 [Aureococcus anophagefferens]